MNLVIGLGEVGRALQTVLDCAGRDIEDNGETGDVLHIAYPWSNRFLTQTVDYQLQYEPNLVIVHSTVPVGTCDLYGWVHSPVRGRHPDLVEALKVFPKWFGGDDAVAAAMLWPYEATATPEAQTTEAAKLWELVQFGLQVRVTQAVYEWCEGYGLNPLVVYRQFAREYNDGYRTLGDGQFTRPVLDYVPGAIGGHCVTEGARLLDHPLAELI